MKEREAYGMKFVVSGETFDEYKGTLQDQLEEAYKEIKRLQNIIKEVREYIEKEKVLPLGEQVDKLLEILDKENI